MNSFTMQQIAWTFGVRLNSPDSYILIILWAALIAVAYWWRQRVSISELEEAQLIGGPVEEQWRLGSEGKKMEQLEESSEDESPTA